GIAEDNLNAMFFQALDEGLCSCEFHALFLTFEFDASSDEDRNINPIYAVRCRARAKTLQNSEF
ncbi:MAG: hypothetical protein CVU68_01240, partial [Deltaproteobacteria bacterium HGW-Deltaproteobacteria-3]